MATGVTPTRPVDLLTSLKAIQWGSPWLHVWRDIGLPIAAAIERGQTLHSALNTAQRQSTSTKSMTFVPQKDLPEGAAYEQFIFDSGQCPTRDNLHDFFNGLVWLRFAHTKHQLNRLQSSAIAAQGVHAVRGRVRDAVTVFDENGAVLVANSQDNEHLEVWRALQQHDWPAALATRRAWWLAQPRLVVFGHALLEKLVQPRKSMVAHAIEVRCEPGESSAFDQAVSARLSAATSVDDRRPFQPIPVMGVPGWSSNNDDACFYDDESVFRPVRSSSSDIQKA